MTTYQTNISRLSGSLVAVPVALIVSAVIISNYKYALLVLAPLFILLFTLKFQIVFPLLLIIRSSLDSFTDIGFQMGPINFNVPAGLSTIIDICGLCYCAGLFLSNRKIINNRVGKAYALWLLALLFWVLLAYRHFGVEGLVGVREWFRLFSIFVVYLLALQLVAVRGIHFLVHCIMISFIIPFAVALYQILLSWSATRAYGTLAHPNPFALYLILGIGLTFWKLKFSIKKKLWLLLLIFELFLLSNTYSIGGAISFAVLGSILIIKETWKKSKYIVVLLMMFFLVLSGLLSSELGKKRFQEIEQTPSLREIVRDEIVTNSLSWRIVNWKQLLQEWTANPLLGYGLGTCVRFVNPWQNEAHNDYLRYLVEIGIVGLTGYLLFIRGVAIHIWSNYKATAAEQPKYLALIVFAIFLAWTTGAVWDNHITATAFQFYFWALLAAI